MQRNKSLMRSCLEWSDAYSVAHPALDAEHREIMLVIDRQFVEPASLPGAIAASREIASIDCR